MGWSCTAKAGEVMNKWTEKCIQSSGKQNEFTVNNKTYFWETSSKEHNDGSITGKIWKMINETQCLPAGTFKINGDGSIARAPKFLKG